MISLNLAKRLKQAGLPWQAGIHDFFAIPDRGMDERVFVISDLQSNLDIFRGWPVVTFHGAAEWALDYILTTEVVWLPSEEQIREAILESLKTQGVPNLTFRFVDGHYQCTLRLDDEWHQFDDPNGPDAYGKALLYLLEYMENG